MKRLVDELGLESSSARLADLFRAAARFEADPFRRRRVFVSLSRIQPRRAARFGMRLQIVATLLVSGTAGAALGRHYVAGDTDYLGLGPAVLAATQQDEPAPRPKRIRRVETALRANDALAADRDFRDEPANAAPSDGTHSAPKSPPRDQPESGEDATNVIEAIEALRTERDPGRAQALLNEYLKTHPRGVLSEDAHALSIEAASAQHDPRAADYARRYLAQFPHGRYQALANRAMAQR